MEWWCGQQFMNYNAIHIPTMDSDHCQLVLNVKHDFTRNESRGFKKRFHFEEMWTTNSSCRDVIKRCWNSNLHIFLDMNVQHNIRECRIGLLKWRT